MAKRARRAILVTVLLAMAVLAGCADDGDPGADGTAGDDGWESDPYDQGNFTGGDDPNIPPGNETGGSGNTSWSYENRTGTVSGTALIVSGGSPQEEMFFVQFDTVSLEINMSLDGDPLEVYVAPPGCEDEACWQSLSGGSFQADGPQEGEWKVVLEPDTMVGPYSTDYELVIGQAVEVP